VSGFQRYNKMTKLTVANSNINTISTSTITSGVVSINASHIVVGDCIISPESIFVPTLLIGGVLYTGSSGGITNVQIFTANGTWTKPSGLSGDEQVFVMMWGGGGGGQSGAGGGGGACVIGTYVASALNSTETVTVGNGGISTVTGGTSTFKTLNAYGGGGSPSQDDGGGGGGWFSAGGSTVSGVTGGAPLGGAISSSGVKGGDSTFGGGGGPVFSDSNGGNGGWSIFGGSAGMNPSGTTHSRSIYGGGGGQSSFLGSSSIFGGKGGSTTSSATTPGGGGAGGATAANYPGARGEVRVWVIK
jgi:hypothetical protein